MAKKAARRTSGKPGSKSANDTWESLMGQSADIYEEAKEEAEKGFAPANIPDGKYIVRITSAKADKYDNNNTKTKAQWPVIPYVSFNATIIAGEHKGTRVSSFNRTNDPKGLASVLKALTAIGYDTHSMKLSEIPEALAEITKDTPVMNATVKNRFSVNLQTKAKQHNQSVYFNEPMNEDEVPADGEDGTDDNTPAEQRPRAKRKTATTGKGRATGRKK